MSLSSGQLAAQSAADAEASSHAQSVERMLELLLVPQQVNNAAAEVVNLYSAKPAAEDADSDTKRLVSAYQQEITRIVNRVLSWDAIKPNYINTYTRKMNAADVAEVTRFLESPAGQQFITSQQEASIEIQQITKHLVEADLAEPITKSRNQLREGIAIVKAKQ